VSFCSRELARELLYFWATSSQGFCSSSRDATPLDEIAARDDELDALDARCTGIRLVTTMTRIEGGDCR
jgi:hypothetical protein